MILGILFAQQIMQNLPQRRSRHCSWSDSTDVTGRPLERGRYERLIRRARMHDQKGLGFDRGRCRLNQLACVDD